MHVQSAQFTNFKRFTDMRIEGLPATARLIVLTGPNGSGKSAVFEGFNWYRRSSGGWGQTRDPWFFPKTDASGQPSTSHQVTVAFHEGEPPDQDARRKSFWIRSAYRHEPDFNAGQLQRQTPALEDPGLEKLIQVEQTVRKNYERLASVILQSVFDPLNDDKRVADFRSEHIGRIQQTMESVFGDLILRSPGDPLEEGTFFFDKGTSNRFHYKNLSAGEKAAFDLILDFHLRAETYDDTVFCIDEPELHLGSRVQGLLLASLFEEMHARCQLWVATHSLGMMRRALELHRQHPGEVVFLDTTGADFDGPTVLAPVAPDRQFWRGVLEMALDDLAGLMAPTGVILCEGADPAGGFDATVYRTIFGYQFPSVEFLSVGSSGEVKKDQSDVANAIEVIAPGTQIVRLVDGDDHSPDEILSLRQQGTRVLGRRNLECYLLDDEILERLCALSGKPEMLPDVLRAREDAVIKAAERGRAPDDLKSARRAIRDFAVRELHLTGSGSNTDEFLRTSVAPLITPDTAVYQELCTAIFGDETVDSARRDDLDRFDGQIPVSND